MTSTTRSPRNTSSAGESPASDTFREILTRAEQPNEDVFAADEIARWPTGTLKAFTALGVLREIERAKGVVCTECEEGCWIEPTPSKDARTGKMVGGHFCRRKDEVGHFYVDLARLKQWQFDMNGSAKAVGAAISTVGRVTILVPGRLAFLGSTRLDGKTQELFLARGAAWPDASQVFGSCSRLKMASHLAILTLAAMPKEPLLAGCELAVRPLVEIAAFDRGRLTVTIDDAFPEVEPGPWADLPNEPITLDKFMAGFCDKRSKESRRYRRQALLAAARNGTVTMPALAGARKRGQPNKYFVHDLLKAWQGFLDEGVDLPPLLPRYRASGTEKPSTAAVQ